ncbi:hypothetical protein D3C78_1658370 [compost metagenome]
MAAASSSGDSITPADASSSGNNCASNGAKRTKRSCAACTSAKPKGAAASAAASAAALSERVHNAGRAARSACKDKEETEAWDGGMNTVAE